MKSSAAGLLLLLVVGFAGAQDAAPTTEALEQRLQGIEKMLAEGQTEPALALVRQVRAEVPKEAPWLLVRTFLLEGAIQIRGKQWAAAETVYTTFIDQYGQWPQAPEAWLQLGRVRRQLGKSDLARQAWNKVIAEAPHAMARMEAEQAILDSLLADGQVVEAEQRADALLKAWPWLETAPWIMVQLGRARLEAGQAKEALAWFERVRAAYPGSAASFEVRRPMVEALDQAGRAKDALALLEQVRADRPEMFVVAEATAMAARMMAEQGEVPQAVTLLDSVVGKYPGTSSAAQAIWLQVELLVKQGDKAAALAIFKAHASEFPGDWWQAQALQVLLDLYGATQAWNDAEDTADALVKLAEGSPLAAQTLLRKAEIQIDADRPKGAKVTLEKVIQTYKGAPVVPQAQMMLEELTQAGNP